MPTRVLMLMTVLGALAWVRAGDVNLDTGSTKEKTTVNRRRFTVTHLGHSPLTTHHSPLPIGFGTDSAPTAAAGADPAPTAAPGADPAPTAAPGADPATTAALAAAPTFAGVVGGAPTAAAGADPAPTAALADAPTFAGVVGGALGGALGAYAGTMAPTAAAPGFAIAAVCLTNSHTAVPSFGGGTSNGAGPSFTDPSFGAGPSNGELNVCSSRTSESWTDVGRPGTPSEEGTDVSRPGTPSPEGNEGEQQPDKEVQQPFP